MADKVEAAVGDGADQVAQGKRNQQQNMRAGDTYVGSPGDFPIWKLMEMAADIRVLVSQMDDLPNKVGRLTDQVGRLERLEVVVKPGPPPEVVIRPVAHDTVNLSVRMIAVIFLVALVVVLVLVAWLVLIQVARV